MEYIAVADTVVLAGSSKLSGKGFVGRNSIGDDSCIAVLTDERDVLACDEGDALRHLKIVAGLHRAAERNRVSTLLDEDAEAGVLVSTGIGCLDGSEQFVYIRDCDVVWRLFNGRTTHGGERQRDSLGNEVVGQVTDAVSWQGEGVLGCIVQTLVFEGCHLAADAWSECHVAQSSLSLLSNLDALVESEHNLTAGRCSGRLVFGYA